SKSATESRPTCKSATESRPTWKSATESRTTLPADEDAEVIFFILEEPVIGCLKAFGLDGMGDEARGAEASIGQGGEQPMLGLVDVPVAGKTGVAGLEEHVAVGAGD